MREHRSETIHFVVGVSVFLLSSVCGLLIGGAVTISHPDWHAPWAIGLLIGAAVGVVVGLVAFLTSKDIAS